MSPTSSRSAPISQSSDESQRELRIQKLVKLREKGVDPFPAVSHRDFSLGFIGFWFDFVHKFNLAKVVEGEDEDLYNLDYFLQQVLFPRTLLEHMEDKLQIRHTVREMGLDPDKDAKDFEEDYDQDLVVEARALFPKLIETSEEQKIAYLKEYLKYSGEDDSPGSEDLNLTLSANQIVTLAGRIKSKRVSGKIAFATVEDEENVKGFQFIFKKDDLDKAPILGKDRPKWQDAVSLSFEDFKDLLDEGDYIQATGKLDYSQRGEPSLFVERFRILTKSLRPLPEKFEDKELRFRKRYIDMLVNPEIRELFRQKSRFWTATKDFMDSHGFTQVFVPVIQETTGGAEANPFVTHNDALDEDFYLGISPELHLKRMVVGGLEKIYDLGRNFRNEGIDDEHLPEFNRVEFYWAYASHQNLIDFTEELMKHALEKAFGTLQLVYKKKDEHGEFTGEEFLVDWAKKWPVMSYYDFIERFGGVDLRKYKKLEDLQKIALKLGVEFEEKATFGRLTDLIYKKIARPKCIEPTWLVDVPTRLSPLAKRDPNNPEITLRSHLLAYGSELTNGFAELNDPIDQLERFQEQQKARDNGDDEAMMIDLDFVNALEIGLPPTVGFAYSDRLFDLVANRTMREATPFPLMRRQKQPGEDRSGQIQSVQILLLNDPEIPLWSKINTAAHLTARLGAKMGKSILGQDSVKTIDQKEVQLSIPHGVVIRQTSKTKDLLELIQKSQETKLEVLFFTKDMRDSKSQKEGIQVISSKKYQDLEILGVLIFGEKKIVEKLTKDFPFLD